MEVHQQRLVGRELNFSFLAYGFREEAAQVSRSRLLFLSRGRHREPVLMLDVLPDTSSSPQGDCRCGYDRKTFSFY